MNKEWKSDKGDKNKEKNKLKRAKGTNSFKFVNL